MEEEGENNDGGGEVKTFKLVVHEILGNVILYCKRKENILAAYASQKYTMKMNSCKNYIFFIAKNVKNIRLMTEKSLINHLIISFEVFLIPMPIFECIKNKFIVFLNDDDNTTTEEIECRRYIDSHHPILQQKLRVSCNDLSNLRYIERNVEIILEEDNYRCIINSERGGFCIQRKYHCYEKEKFIKEIKCLELLHYSKESPFFNDSCYYLIHCQNKTIIGLASFLDCNNVAVKTTYLNDNEGTILYQRIILDDYKKQQPFILEHEFSSSTSCNLQSLKNYFNISCLLDAKLPINKYFSGYNNPSSKPINCDDEKKKIIIFLF